MHNLLQWAKINFFFNKSLSLRKPPLKPPMRHFSCMVSDDTAVLGHTFWKSLGEMSSSEWETSWESQPEASCTAGSLGVTDSSLEGDLTHSCPVTRGSCPPDLESWSWEWKTGHIKIRTTIFSGIHILPWCLPWEMVHVSLVPPIPLNKAFALDIWHVLHFSHPVLTCP